MDEVLIEVDDDLPDRPQVFRCTGAIVLVAPNGEFEGVVDCDWAGVREDLERGNQCPECGSEDTVPAFSPAVYR